MADQLFTPSEIGADLDRLEKLFKRISTEWEMFLARSVRWPPHQRQAEIEAIIRHYLKAPPQRTPDRFRFNTMVHRYRTNSERWRRRLRLLEETGSSRPGSPRRGRQAEIEDISRPHVLLSTRLRKGDASPDQMRDAYLAFRRARKARGHNVAKLTYRAFAEKISQHLGKVRDHAEGRPLELRVDELGGKVRIAVRACKTPVETS